VRRLDRARWFHRIALVMGPSGFAAVLAGWVTTEVGRQPYVAYGVMRTSEALAPVSAAQVATSLAVFLIAYAIVFTAGAIYILRLINTGPEADHAAPAAPDRGPNTTLAGAPLGGPEPAAAAE
jgi:cytochrome d ubiquinol oxidase subunit I